MKEIVQVWLVLLLVPLVPVFLLYWFFGTQNFFELENTARGIVAAGPIAAYIGMVWVGWRLYSRVTMVVDPRHPALRHLPGRWDLESRSAHGTVYSGTARIRCQRSRVHLDGSFVQDDTPIGSWESQAALLLDGRLYVIYSTTEQKQGGVERLAGVCILGVDEQPFDRMEGHWIVLGRENMSGTIVYRRPGE